MRYIGNTAMTFVAVLMVLGTLPADRAEAARCGGNNQRACRVWERIPSCNKGLTELRRPGFCTKAPPIQNVKCGALGQRPCPVTVRIPSCDKNLKEDFVRNKCVSKSSGGSVAELGKACFARLKHLGSSLVPVARCLNSSSIYDRLKAQFKQKDAGGLKRTLLSGACSGAIRKSASALRQNGLRTITLGISGELGAGVGVLSEFFLAINTDLRGNVHLYETLGYKFGKFGGGSVNAVVTAHNAPANALAGDAQSFSVSLKAIGGAGGSVGLSYEKGGRPPQCTSLSAAAGAGAEANAGSINRHTTIRLF